MTEQERPELYPTRYGGKPINAVNGVPYDFDQGAFQQNGLFSVTYTVGDYDSRGFKLPAGRCNDDAPLKFLFDSPDQYYNYWEVPFEERDPNLIQKWKKRKSTLSN